MKDPNSPPASSRRKAAVLFGVGLLSGAALGLLFGGGRFSGDAGGATKKSPEKSAVTFGGTAASKGPPGDPLGKFLNLGTLKALPVGT